ncbi:hybrid sensor histidine kinase/response regulator [Dulcicalothrix desertica PCC 7102]|uniref:Circadian input-output histidine kinase CikA n=1 Tax=Dulcicalothrix desertica PCC 7102 TaxID=232991 RepID=A0A433V2M9_9CYAN|nr:response regulator [Dulcicalothrix desertica]RUT00352.1 hybrid sensor histidine kinase/response regulator [Dulcicalothrix desertica PCC 7102]TWH42459.1 PAS domain S-box-containing protein [Dulcicalothrix desertica PCC 7102]
MSIHILLIDDNPNDRFLAARELKLKFAQGITFDEITNEEDFEQALLTGNLDLAVTDNKLLWIEGLTVVKKIKDKYPNCPVIMFTDSGSEEIAVEAMKAGLDDYVLKKQHYRRLVVAIEKCLEQKRIKEEYVANQKLLYEHQERFRVAQDAANLGIWDWDLITNTITWNDNHERLFGLEIGSFDGRYETFINCVYNEDRDLISQALEFALENNSDFYQEFRVVWSDNSIHWIASKGHFFYDDSSKAIRASGIILDITDRKEREVAQQRYTEELVQAYSVQDEFLSIASHELRTPLNAILGWTQLLRKYPFDEKTRNQRLEVIERNLKRQQGVVEQILDISRLKSGQMQFERKVVDLKSVIEGAIDSTQLPVRAKSISLEYVCNDSTVEVLGDKSKLYQVILNLLSNAIKFTPEKGTVKVCIDVNRNSENSVQISISDTGQGISDKFLPYVFEQFRQEDGSRTRTHQGAGLGLTIARKLIEMHGGTIEAESQGVNQGATFTIRLPLLNKVTSTENTTIQGANTNYSTLKNSLLKGLKILVVDDETDTLDLLVMLLENEGATVTAVNSATQALQILQTNKPDILISDLIMPDKDGYMLLEEAKTLGLQWTEPLKSVAISGYANESNDKIMRAGFQASISKPIEPDELVDIINFITNNSLDI